jgi:hypothetical protein
MHRDVPPALIGSSFRAVSRCPKGDDHSVADAGLALVAVLSEKLGLEGLAQELALHSALLVDTICHR